MLRAANIQRVVVPQTKTHLKSHPLAYLPNFCCKLAIAMSSAWSTASNSRGVKCPISPLSWPQSIGRGGTWCNNQCTKAVNLFSWSVGKEKPNNHAQVLLNIAQALLTQKLCTVRCMGGYSEQQCGHYGKLVQFSNLQLGPHHPNSVSPHRTSTPVSAKISANWFNLI